MNQEREMLTIERDTVQSAYEVLMGTWAGAACDRGCGCVLHALREALGIEETDEDYTTVRWLRENA